MHQQKPEKLTQWLQVIQAEYIEMPGLQLTKPQVRRLWNLDEPLCDALLDALVNAQFLARTHKQAYALAGATPTSASPTTFALGSRHADRRPPARPRRHR